MKSNSRIIKVIAVDSKYRRESYPSIPVKDDGIGTYITGQHIDPADPNTKGNLTVDEMTGKTVLTKTKAAEFPFVINPLFKVPIIHGSKLDLSTDETGEYINPHDKALYNYFQYQDVVAPSKDKVISGKHFFYLEDLVVEAQKRVAKEDLIFEAQMNIRKCTLDQWRDIALLLNFKIKNFNIDVTILTETQIKDKLIQQCKTDPETIISCFNDGVKEDIFILKLRQKGILTYKNQSFYDGSKYVGQTLEDVKAFMKKDEGKEFIQKWGQLLNEKTDDNS